MAQEITETYKY